jgi:2-oxoglutarate ferredoxin oxidoreductase subunit beta
MRSVDAQVVYQRPRSFTETVTHYCPGCTHGVSHRLVAEVLDEMGLREHSIGVASVGCSVFAYNYFDIDFVQAAHGRAPAMATGIKRVFPDRTVFTPPPAVRTSPLSSSTTPSMA